MPKMYTLRALGPCPDPDKYTRVKMGKLYYWRKKRGTVNPVVLNEAFQANANNTAITNNAAKEIIQKLAPFLERLIVKRPLANIGGRLKKGINANGKLDYHFLKGYEIQEAHPLKSMLRINFPFSVSNDMVSVAFDLDKFSVKELNTLVTQYFLEIILLHGELLSEAGLRIETDTSRLFDFHKDFTEKLELSLLLPESAPWMLILKLSCLEGKERANHPKFHVMRVIGTGRGRHEQNERIML